MNSPTTTTLTTTTTTAKRFPNANALFDIGRTRMRTVVCCLDWSGEGRVKVGAGERRNTLYIPVATKVMVVVKEEREREREGDNMNGIVLHSDYCTPTGRAADVITL